MSDEPKPESEMYISPVVPDGPETNALVSINRIKASELTDEHIGKFVGCHDPNVGNFGAKIISVRRDDNPPNPGMLVAIQSPDKPGLVSAGRITGMRLKFDHEVELAEMMAW